MLEQQSDSSQFNPLSREYQLECTLKQLMQERNDMHNSLLQTRQQLENAIKIKNQQSEEIIKLQKKIDTLELQLQHKKLQDQILRREQQRRVTKKTTLETEGWGFDQIIKNDHARNPSRLEIVLGFNSLEIAQTGAIVGQTTPIINEFQKILCSNSEQQGDQQEFDDFSPIIGTRTIVSKEIGICDGQDQQIVEQQPINYQTSSELDEFHEQLVNDIGTTGFGRILRKLLS